MLRQLIGLVGYVALFAVLLFVPAGTLRWPAAWELLATLALVRGVSTMLLWRTRRDLLEARTSVPLPQAGQAGLDRLLLPLLMAMFAGLVAFTSADVWHWNILPPPPHWLAVLGLLLFAVGWWVVYLALRANAFALTVVKLQADREQAVVSDGPYGIVRHPMYAGLVCVMVGLPLWLESLAGVIAAVIPCVLLAMRILVEERVLRSGLAGYNAYAERVRWRFIPGVW